MIIVLEGIDNTGKSTLATRISKRIAVPVQHSEGPPKYHGEMDERLKRYSLLHNIIFDRHPVVSQDIYGTMRSHNQVYDPVWRDMFYKAKPMFIYCDPGDTRRLEQHVVKKWETRHHINQVHDHYDDLLKLYRAWAIRHAHIIYRIGDSLVPIISATIAWRNICSIRSKISPTSTASSA